MKKNNYNSRIQKRNIKSKKRKKFLWFLIPLLVLIGATAGYGAYLYDKASDIASGSFDDADIGTSKYRNPEEAVDPSEDNVSVLFIGVDAREGLSNQGNSRSDALVLATLNKEDHSVMLLSIPRDSYVYIPEVGYTDKINHAHAYGGPKASIEAVESLLDIPVDYYVKMNFNAFIDVVDALDGITANVPYELYEMNSRDQKGAIHLLPGEQTLNGEEALALARTRKLDNDIERGKRQQEVIKAIMNKAISLNSIFKYGEVMEAVGSNMKTNMTFDQMKKFVSYGMNGSLDIETLTLAGSDTRINGTYYYQLNDSNVNEIQQTLRAHLGLENSQSVSLSE